MKHIFSRGLTALALAGLAACGDSGGAPNGSGQLTLVLKDGPGTVTAAVVTIDQIYLQGSGGRTVLSSTPVTTNLVTLAADAATLVDDFVIPAGTYSELRFVISGGYVEVDEGNSTPSIYASSPNYAGLPPGAVVTGDLQMPSLGTSGLKVKLPANELTVTSGSSKILVVDFDVSQNFKIQGNPNTPAGLKGVLFTPVLRAVVRDVAGSISGTVTSSAAGNPGIAGLNVQATMNVNGDQVVVNAVTDANGDYTISFLAPGTYAVTVQGFTPTDPATMPRTVEVGESQDVTDVDFTGTKT